MKYDWKWNKNFTCFPCYMRLDIDCKKVTFLFAVVHGAKYVFFSRDVPSQWQLFSYNLCWHVSESTLIQNRDCQFFKIHTPGRRIYDRKEAATVSVESVCQPGYFLVQKNYRFVLEKPEMATNKTIFGRCSGKFSSLYHKHFQNIY